MSPTHSLPFLDQTTGPSDPLALPALDQVQTKPVESHSEWVPVVELHPFADCSLNPIAEDLA